MTNKQQQDIKSVIYFIPDEYRNIEITNSDKQKYLEWSEGGLHKELDLGKFTRPRTGIEALMLGKSRRGLHTGMWEGGVLEGSVPYDTLFSDCPKSVIKFMAKEMFQGIDYKIIMQYPRNEKEAESI